MARHKRRAPRWLVTRRTHAALQRRYDELHHVYRDLLNDHVALVGDLEEMMTAPPVRQTSWGAEREAADDRFFDAAATQPLPAMAPQKAISLVKEAELLESPSGTWRVKEDESG